MAGQDSGATAFTQFFVAFQLLGAGFLGAAVLTVMLSPRVNRNAMWTNYLITWIISALSYSLLLFAGAQTGPQPSYGLCLTQSVLLYGAPPLTALSGFALIIQLYYDVSASLYATKRLGPAGDLALLIAPYGGFLVITITSLFYAVNRPVARTVNDTYCHVTDGQLGTISAIFVAIVLVGCLGLLGYTAALLLRMRGAVGVAGTQSAARVMLVRLARVGAFTMAIAVAIGTSAVYTSHNSGRSLMDGVLASLPLLLFLILGLQPLIDEWEFFWRRGSGGSRGRSKGNTIELSPPSRRPNDSKTADVPLEQLDV